MTDQDFHVIASTKEAAHQAITQGYAHAKALIANGERVHIAVGVELDDIGTQQRRFLHGPVLGQISEQVRLNGERFTSDLWKEFFRRLYLPDRWVSRKLPGHKRSTPHRVRQSTEDLGVKGYSEFIDKVIAHATTELDVEFRFINEEREACRYVKPTRKTTKAARAVETEGQTT